MSTTRLFTVEVQHFKAELIGRKIFQDAYECWFATLHFSRQRETDLKHWVRVAARNVYGKNTKVIFVHKEGADQ